VPRSVPRHQRSGERHRRQSVLDRHQAGRADPAQLHQLGAGAHAPRWSAGGDSQTLAGKHRPHAGLGAHGGLSRCRAMDGYHFYFAPIWATLPDIYAATGVAALVAVTSMALALVIGTAAALAAEYGGGPRQGGGGAPPPPP